MSRLFAPDSSAPLENGLYDRVMRASKAAPTPDIALVTIDSESIGKLGAWPWSRDLHASVLDRLTSAGAKVVAFTDPFDASQSRSEVESIREALRLLEASDFSDSPQANQLRALLRRAGGSKDPNVHLAAAITAHGNVILPIALQRSGIDDPIDLRKHTAEARTARTLLRTDSFRATSAPAQQVVDRASALGHTYFANDTDGVARTDSSFARVGEVALPSLAMAIAARVRDIPPGELSVGDDGKLVLGTNVIPLDRQLRARPRFYGSKAQPSFPSYPFWQVVAGDVGRDQLQGKIVLVGATDPGVLGDRMLATPVSAATSPLIATASAVSSYLVGANLSTPPLARAIEWAAAAAAILFAAFALPAAGLAMGAVATALLIAVLLIAEVGLLSSLQAWAKLVTPALAVGAGYGIYMVGELIRRANMKGETKDPAKHLRSLGQTFQKQGQLDLAFETFQRCPLDAQTMDLLYNLGLDYERRRQSQKAAAVYTYIAGAEPNYRDVRMRRARLKEEPRLPKPVTRPPAPATRPPPVAAVEDQEPDFFSATIPSGTGRTLGRYQIERELGKGAMGTVYLGRDPKINRVVAIKAIPLADEFEEEDLAEARARFFREAEMAGRLNHPAIVTVYDAGEDDGLAFIAMEYLRGQHLSHFTDPARLLPPKTVMLLVARVAEALHYAHRQNVVHRDIKPANIMFNPDTDELKITDFGIARLTDTSRTKTGIVLGTPSFMSPEQLEGRPIDGRSDQFALGVSLYQLLCGQLPFRAESMPRLMQKIATEPHTPVRLVRPELPECIDRILDRALAKDADQRYATCAEFGLALRACVGTEEPRRTAEAQHEWLIP
jgi:CHASE2 domain-containing sensor protein/predicted Ser/Thr protein kinase